MPPTRARIAFNPKTAGSRLANSVLTLLLVAALPLAASAHDPDAPTATAGQGGGEHGNLSEIGAKLSNPVSDLWAMFTQFGVTWSDGDVNTGDAEIGGNMIFQPILPVPLYGEGDNRWQVLVR